MSSIAEASPTHTCRCGSQERIPAPSTGSALITAPLLHAHSRGQIIQDQGDRVRRRI